MKHRFFLIILALLILVSAAALADQLNTWDEVEQVLVQAAGNNSPSVTFELGSSLFGQLQADNSPLYRAAYKAGFSEISWHWWPSGKVEITSMTKFTCPYRSVRTEAELVSAVSAMRESGARDFVLLLDPSLYASLQNNYKLKKALLLEGGLYHWESGYSYDGSCRLDYCSCTYWDGAVRRANSESEALTAIEEVAALGYDSFALVLDPGTYSRLTQSEKLRAAFLAAAYLECNAYTYDSEQILLYTRDNQSVFYPGYDILRSVRNGTEDKLPDKLKKTLQEARRMLSGITGTPAEKAIAIHDLLCRHITYTIDDSTDDDDRCIGAILDGKANCDGYSDAFLLLCGLENIPVKLVHGNALYPSDPSDDGAHMWNLILLDGTWRGVDVTWDDQEQSIVYYNYNTGDDRIKASLDYLTDFLPSNRLVKTDLLDRPVPEYKVESEKDLINALQKAAGMKKTQAVLWLSESLYRDYQAASSPIWKWMDLAGISGQVSHKDNRRMIIVSDIQPLGSGVLVGEADTEQKIISLMRSAAEKSKLIVYCSDSLFRSYQSSVSPFWKWMDLAGISGESAYYNDRHSIIISDIKPLGSGILVAEAGSSGEMIRVLRAANRRTVTDIRIYCSPSFFSEYNADQGKIWSWIDSGGISSASVSHSNDLQAFYFENITWK